MVLFVPLSTTAGKSSIRSRYRSEIPFVVANCTAPVPTGSCFARVKLTTACESLLLVLPLAFAGKLVHTSVAPPRLFPENVIGVVRPGATADEDASDSEGT